MRRAHHRLVRGIAGVGVLAVLAGCTGTAGIASISPVGTTSGASTAASATAAVTGAGRAGARPGAGATPSDAPASATDTRPPLDLPKLPDIISPAVAPADRTDQLAQAMSDSGTATLQQAIDVYSLSVSPLPGATPFTLPPGE